MNSILQKIIDSLPEDERFPEDWEEEPIQGERQIIPATTIHQVKLTKTLLNHIIRWSSSRYNEYKKPEVVEIAYKILSGEWEDSIQVYSSGSYCECSAMTHTGTYLVNGPEQYIATVQEIWNPDTHVTDLHEIERWETK